MRSIRFVVLAALAAVLVALTSTAATARPDGAAAKRVTVTFWHAYAENPAAPEMQRLTKIVIPRFEKLNPGIKVQQVPFSYGNLQQKLTTSAAGGTLPDLIRSDSPGCLEYARLGVFAPLNKVMPDFKRFANAMFPGTLATNFYKGNYYGLPLDTNTRILMYNREALRRPGSARRRRRLRHCARPPRSQGEGRLPVRGRRNRRLERAAVDLVRRRHPDERELHQGDGLPEQREERRRGAAARRPLQAGRRSRR